MAWYSIFKGGRKTGETDNRRNGGREDGRTESRGTPAPSPLNTYASLGMTSVSSDAALSIGAVFSCAKVIREAISSLSRNVYIDTGKEKNKATKHRIQFLIKKKPNPRNTWTELINLWVADYLLHGNGYLWVQRDQYANPLAIYYVKHSDVTPVIMDGMAYYKIKGQIYEYSDILHLRDLWGDALKGISKIKQHAYTLGKLQSVGEMQNKNYSNGLMIGAVVTYPADAEMDPEQVTQVEEIFKKKYSSGKSEVAFLGGGATFQQFKPSMSFADASIIADINLTKTDICGIFSVPPHKIGILDNSSYSSFKQLQIDFQSGAILPIVKLIEEQLMKLLKESEQGKYYIKIEIDSLLRADPIESVNLIAQAIGIGLLSVNEGRELLDRNPVKGGDKHYIPSNNLRPIDEPMPKME